MSKNLKFQFFSLKILFAGIFFLTFNQLCQADTVNITLKTGKNLVCLPINPQDNSIEQVLSSISSNLIGVWEYNPDNSVNQRNPWQYYKPGANSSLTTMSSNIAYWIEVSSDTNLTITGTPGSAKTEYIWRESFSPFTWIRSNSQSIISGLADLGLVFGIDYDQVSRFNNTAKTWEHFRNNPQTDTFLDFEPNQVYYIHITETRLSYDFLKNSLIKYTMPDNTEVLLVPLMNPDPYLASRPQAFEDVYHEFTAAIILSVLVEKKDWQTAEQVGEFYLKLFKDSNKPTRYSFPEVYKPDENSCVKTYLTNPGHKYISIASTNPQAIPKVMPDQGNFDFTQDELDFVQLKSTLINHSDNLQDIDFLILNKIPELNAFSHDHYPIADITDILNNLDQNYLQSVFNNTMLDKDLYIHFTLAQLTDEKAQNIYTKVAAKNDFSYFELMYLNRAIFIAKYVNRGIKSDTVIEKKRIRGMGPNAWLANAFANYWFGLYQKPNLTSQEQQLMSEIHDLTKALANWLYWLQNDGLSLYLANNDKTIADVPWLANGICGGVVEQDNSDQTVESGPYTEGSAAGYAVFRKMEKIETILGNLAEAQKYKTAADNLGQWFHNVVDGKTARVYVGRNLNGTLIEGIPGTIAEAIDTYAFLIMAGVLDNSLANLGLSRINEINTRLSLTSFEGHKVNGLAFGPQAKNAIFWGPHGQVAMAGWLMQHPLNLTLAQDMNQGSWQAKLSSFTPSGIYTNDWDRIDDWTGMPSENVWVGWLGQYSLEPTAWYYMRNSFLPAFRENKIQPYNILGPITWEPTINLNDPLTDVPVIPIEVKFLADDNQEPCSPILTDPNKINPLIEDSPFTLVTSDNSITRNGHDLLKISVDNNATNDPNQRGQKRTVLFTYVPDTTVIPDTYSFYVKADNSFTSIELEIKDEQGNCHFFNLSAIPRDQIIKVIIDIKNFAATINQTKVREFMLHLTCENSGTVFLDGIGRK